MEIIMGNFEQTKIVLVDNNEQMRTSIKQQMQGEEVKIVADFSDAISALMSGISLCA